jgi:chromosome segregation ATPase
MRDELEKDKAEIEAKSKPLREERDKLRKEITPTLDRLRELDKEIHAIEQPGLREIHKQLVGLVKAIGVKKEAVA